MKHSTTRELLRELKSQPRALRIAAVIYLLHILCQGKTALSELTAFLTIVFLGFAIARSNIRPSFHIIYFPLVLYAIASSVSAIVNGATIHAFADAITWFKILIFPAALIMFRSVPPLRHLALRTQIVFAVFISINGIVEYLVQDQATLENRITGPVSHVMTYSGLLLPPALLLLVLAFHRRSVWLVGSATMLSLALSLTYTRSVWLGWGIAVVILLILERPRWIPLAAAAGLVFLTFMPMSFFGRLVSTFDVEQSSNLDRIRMAEGGVEMIKDNPVVGVGPAYIKEVYPLYRGADAPRFRIPHLHNNVLQLWAERGILGLVAYLTLMGLFLRECIKGWRGPNREFAQAGLAITVALGIAGLFEFNFGDIEVFFMTLELMALIVVFLERPDESGPNEVRPAVVAAGSGRAAATP
ncbi:MAG: O-antigen ligase family protein [Thermoanaerobaculia bacterium]